MQRSKGFTLIELLVVIAIIAILAAILFPVFAQARAKARAISCLSNLKQIGTAVNMYVQDFDETLPPGWTHGPTDAQNGNQMWRMSLRPYIQKYGHATDAYADGGAQKFNFGIFKCPDHKTDAPTNYGWNSDELAEGWNEFMPGRFNGSGKSLAAIHRPASLVILADGGGEVVQNTGNADPNINDGVGSCNIQTGVGDCGPYKFNPEVWKEGWSLDWNFGVPGRNGDWKVQSGYGGARRPMPRHNKMINAVFADGHAKALHGNTLKARLGSEADVWHNHDVPNK